MLSKDSRFTSVQLVLFAVVLLFTGFILGTMHYDIDVLTFAQDTNTQTYNPKDQIPSKPKQAIQTAKSVERAINYVSQRARPGVVTIFTRKEVEVQGFPFRSPRGRTPFDEFFERFFQPPESRSREVTGLGSGVIMRSDGYILTNYHVIAQADEIEVMLNNRKSVKATVVGTDEHSDLAVLKIDRTGLPTLDFADSSKVKVGDYAIAIGSPFQMRNSVSVGHVSALHRAINARRFEDLIQTDAAINQGNSGGPLVNIEGEIIGINTLILSQGSSGSQGVGFAISANLAQRTAKDLIKYGKVKRPWLGVVIQEVTPEIAEHVEAKGGVIVAEVKDGSPADEAGIEPGEVILEFNGEPVETPHDLQRRVLAQNIGEQVPVTLSNQEGETRTVSVELGELPSGEEETSRQPDRNDQSETPEDMSAQLGLSLTQLSPEEARSQGVVPPRPVLQIEDVARGSAAARANLRPGDLILRIGNEAISSLERFNTILAELKQRGEDKVLLLARRDSNFFTALPLNTE
jgi:serine protease Do